MIILQQQKAIAKELNILEPQDKSNNRKELDQIPQESWLKEIKIIQYLQGLHQNIK